MQSGITTAPMGYMTPQQQAMQQLEMQLQGMRQQEMQLQAMQQQGQMSPQQQQAIQQQIMQLQAMQQQLIKQQAMQQQLMQQQPMQQQGQMSPEQQQAMQQQAMQQQAIREQELQQLKQQQAIQQQVPMTPEQQKATQQAQMTPEQQPAQMTPEQQQAMQQQAIQQKQAYLSGIQGQPAMQQQVPMTPEQQKQAYLSSIQGQQIMGQSNTSTTSIYRGSKVQIPINYQICPPPTNGQNIILVTAVQPSGQCTNPSIQTLTSLGVCVENGYSLVPNGTCPSGPMPQSMREGIFGKMHPLKMKRVNPIKPIPQPQPNCNSYISDASSLLDQISQSINGTLVPSINNILTQNGENSLPSFVKPVNNTTLKKGYLNQTQSAST